MTEDEIDKAHQRSIDNDLRRLRKQTLIAWA